MLHRATRALLAVLVILVTAAPSTPAAVVPEVRVLPPGAPPEILAVDIPTTVYCGQTATGSMIASSNVASVELRIAGYSRVMQKVAPGRFTIVVKVPQLAPRLRRTYALEVIARNTRGDAVREYFSITVR